MHDTTKDKKKAEATGGDSHDQCARARDRCTGTHETKSWARISHRVGMFDPFLRSGGGRTEMGAGVRGVGLGAGEKEEKNRS